MSWIVLASASAARARMLREAGFQVEVVPSGAPEDDLPHDDPHALAGALARRKALHVAASRPGSWVLGADQVVHDGASVFGKPRSVVDHAATLRGMRGRSHTLVSAFCVVAPGGAVTVGDARTTLRVRADVGDDEIDAYVASGEGRWCAGGYAAEGHGAFLFEAIEGDWFNVLGLPLFSVMSVLRSCGWRYAGGGWSVAS
jgi:septum formation protein